MTDLQKKLAAATAALLAALGVWTVAGKPTLPSSGGVPVAVSKWGCPDSLPEAIIVRRTGNPVRTICGGKGMIQTLFVHVEYTEVDPAKPLQGNTVQMVMDVPKKSFAPYSGVTFTKAATDKYYVPRDTTVYRGVGMGRMIKQSVGLTPADAAIITLASDSLNIRKAAPNTWYYIPVYGMVERTLLESYRGSCWGGDPDPACVGKPTRLVTTWMNEYKPVAPADGVLEIWMTNPTGVLFIPSLSTN